MANTLMFEVGIKSAQEQLDKIKQEFTKANGELQKLLTLKVSLEGVDAAVKMLSQIGDTTALRNLRNEVAALNREFSILSKGAGGTGDIAGRGIAADIERTSQSIERYTAKIRELTEERSRLVGGTRNSNYQTLTGEIENYTLRLEGARKKLADLEAQKSHSASDNTFKKPTQDAQAFETALTRIEAAIGGLKSGMNVNLTGDFARWATEIQNVTVAVKELVEQFKQLQQGRAALAKEENKVVAAEEKLSQLRGTGATAQTSLFDVQKFKSLQEVIDKIIGELNRLQSAFSGIGKIEGLTRLTTDINALMHNVTNLKDVLSNLSAAVKLDSSSEIIQRLTADFDKVRKEADAAQHTIRTLTEQLNNLAAAQNKVSESASKTGKTETQVTDSQKALFSRYQKLMADLMNIKREIVNIQQSKGGGGAFGRELGEYFSNLNRIRNEIREITSAPSLADAIAKGMSSEKLAKLASSLSALRTSYKETINEAKAFNKSVDKGSSQSETRIKKLGIAFNELKNYIKANGGSDEMHRLQAEIQGAIQKMRQLMNVGDYTGAVRVFDNMSGAIRQAANATKAYDRAKNQATSSTIQLTEAEQRLAYAIKGSTDQMKGQVNILSDLKSMAMQYLGVWGAQQFVHNIIQIGGQLEQQRLSIGAILGDMAAGQHLFDQIKELALTSPFGVMELDKDTKQLSAYGFKQSELFDMTKRLADISAGAGTEVSRLALALGHVRSEGALTGYTLRQFAMNNIPMLQKLSERLTKLEGQIVSTAEIRKRVSKKEIGYEDVIAVIKDLTNEGGMFFNMQETMADAVNAKFKNLRDSMDIMYGEMAEGGIGAVLKKIAESLMFLTRNWEETARVVGYGTAAFITYRVAVAAANTQMLTYGSTLGATTRTLNAKAIALGVNSAAVKRLTADEIDEMVTLKLVTREQLLNAVATKKLTVDQAELAAATFGVTRAELTSIATKGKLGIASAGLGLRLRSLALSIRGVGVALKSMLLNPVGIALMAITAGFEVFMRWKQRNAEIEESIERLGQKGSEGYKNLAATMEKYSGKNGKMSESEYSTAITDIMDALKNYAPNIHNIQTEAQAIDDLAGRYEYLKKELESTKNAYADLEKTKSFASNANEATGNMLNDTFTENVKDYIGNVKEADEAEQELLQHRIALEKTLDELEKKYAFKRRTDASGNALPLVEQMKYIRNTDWNKVFAPMLYSNAQGASAAFNAYSAALNQMEERMRNEVMPDLQNFASRLNNQYAGTFGKDWKENADHIKTAWMAVSSEIDKVPGMTDNVRRDLLEKIFNETWHLNIDFSTGEVTESLTGWRKEMQDWLDEHGLNFKVGFNDSREDIYKKAKAAQEAAQTEMNNAGQVLIHLGFKLDNLPKELPAPFAPSAWNQKNFEDYMEQKSNDKLWEEFQKHFGANWQTKQEKANAKKNKGSNEDKEAKRLREVIKLYKDAYEWYNKYEKQVGEGSALTKVQEQFKPLFEQFKDQFNQELSLDSIPMYKQNLESLLTEAEKIYNDPKHKNSYMVEAIKQIRDAINNVEFEELGRKQEQFASEMTRQIDELTRKWDIFNSVLSTTGDRMLAARLTGITPGATAADLKRLNVSKFAGTGIDFESVLGMSDEEIDKYAENLDIAKDKIKGVQNGLKDWKKAQEEIVKSDIQDYAKWLGSLVDLQSIQARNQEEYNQVLESTNRLLKEGVITQEEADKRTTSAKTTLETKNWQATTMYSNLYNNSRQMAKSEFSGAYNRELASLQAQLDAGIITIQDYTDKVAKLNKVAAEFRTDGFLGMRGGVGAYLGGGYQGLINHHLDKANKLRTEGDEDAAKEEEVAAESMQKAQKTADQLAKAFQDLSNGADMLSNMFQALGMDGAANAFGDAAGVLGGMAGGAQSLSAFGPWGMAAGAAIGGITSIAQLHDKKRERQIEELKREVSKIDNTLNLIKNIRERTLGYDRGDLRRQMAAQYQSQMNSRNFLGMTIDMNPSASAMYEYYSRGGLSGNGYKQELEALKKQREMYEEMFDLEQEKKDSSSEALEEYKQKMAELDMTILNFAQDLADELFGIDLKGWADQIGDALMTAFENGEDAAEAFKDTVQDIMRQVLRKMLSLGIIQPMMERLQKRLFGENGEGGSFDATNPEGTIDAAMRDVAEFFGEGGEGQKMIEATQTFYNRWEDFMKSQGMTLDKNDSSSSTSSGIKGITEQTADLLASYLNATRASTSNIENLSAQYFPLFYSSITSGNASLVNIQQNTAAIMRSNDAIERSNQAILENINGLKNKTWKVPMA